MPVTEVVVFATPIGQPAPHREPPQPPVIDQHDQMFSPHVLVVQTGTAVAFPNHDTVSHHVYSFSQPKPFELPLYKGTAYPPVIFDEPGIVDVGCNIHDQMEAHIAIVDTPYFAITADDGRAVITDLPAGRYSVQVYTPRLRISALPAPTEIAIDAAGDAQLQLHFESRLSPPHTADNESLHWSHY